MSGQNLMVVVNVAKWPDDFAKHRMYCCPATEEGFAAGYKHYPTRFIGNYVSKGVRYVGVVAACVHLRKEGADRVLWKYDEIKDAEAMRRAEEVRAVTRRNPRPCLVFLQSQLAATDFAYDLSGGLMGSRQYFDVSSLDTEDIKRLAQGLRVVTWSTLPKRNS